MTHRHSKAYPSKHEPTLFYYCASIGNIGTTLKQSWFNVSSLLVVCCVIKPTSVSNFAQVHQAYRPRVRLPLLHSHPSSKKKTLTQCLLNIGPASWTVDPALNQHLGHVLCRPTVPIMARRPVHNYTPKNLTRHGSPAV